MTANQTRALTALLQASTQAQAAKMAGLDERSIRRYLANPSFQAEYKKALSGLIDEATAQAKKALSPALSVLQEIVTDETQPPSARISAARNLLEYSLKLVEKVDIVERIDQLEAAVSTLEGGDYR